MILVLATRNPAKGREMARLLAPVPPVVVVRSLADFPGCPDVTEDGDTFAANALLKARSAHRCTGLWAVADDSGLVVDALGGEPGVNSARYCGRHGDDAANNRLLLDKLAGKPLAERTARFVAAVALAGPGGAESVWHGECEGQIALAPRGQGGFGYDCLFWRPDYGQTFAELSGEQKDAVSHRGRAFAQAKSAIWRRLGAGGG